MSSTHIKGYVLFGMAPGLDATPGLRFTLHAPYAGCRICGELYQSDLDRELSDYLRLWHEDPPPELVINSARRRERWRALHTRRVHSTHEVDLFNMSGLTFTPSAANKLAPFGIIPMTDAALSEEVAQSLFEAKRLPDDDVEGT